MNILQVNKALNIGQKGHVTEINLVTDLQNLNQRYRYSNFSKRPIFNPFILNFGGFWSD